MWRRWDQHSPNLARVHVAAHRPGAPRLRAWLRTAAVGLASVAVGTLGGRLRASLCGPVRASYAMRLTLPAGG